MLAVAHGHPVDASVLGNLRRASKHAQAGDECMASMHIALARLPGMRNPRDAARRLFIADGLIEDGVEPRDIWAALDFDPEPLDTLEKEYNPDQPRVPAGSGETSGQWTSGGAVASASVAIAAADRGAQSAAEEALRALQARAAQALGRLPGALIDAAELASRISPPVAFLSELLHPSETGGARVEGNVRDFPDLSYSRQEDETALHIVRQSDGCTILMMYPTGKGTYVDLNSGAVAHMEDDELLIGAPPAALPRTQERTDKPDLCPETDFDKAGRTGPKGEKDKDYEDYVKRIINPDDPTLRGFGYQLPNPLKGGKLVFYDDCQHESGMMVEAKGTGYAAMLAKPDGFMKRRLTEDWVAQAKREVAAAGDRPVEWRFAEEGAADYARTVFESTPGLEDIDVIYTYWREGMQ